MAFDIIGPHSRVSIDDSANNCESRVDINAAKAPTITIPVNHCGLYWDSIKGMI